MENILIGFKQLGGILDCLSLGSVVLSPDRRILGINRSAEQLTDRKADDVVGKFCYEVFRDYLCGGSCRYVDGLQAPPDGLEVCAEIEITDVTSGEHSITRIEAPLYGPDQRPAGCIQVFQDHTVLKSLIRRIRYDDLRLKIILDNLDIGVLTVDRGGHITFFDMVGKDPVMRKIFEIVPVIAASDATILIEGPTGTGKDLLAKIIHNASPRAGKPLVKVNCAALPDTLLESEFFGYVKGAFTGADQNKPGRFQEADGGTIFLDEIGDLPLSLQAKLLRVLEDREFYPLGSRRTTKVDVRIISASNLGFALIICQGKVIERRHLPVFLLKNGAGAPPRTSSERRPERDRILQLLQDHGGNRGKTARALKINRTTLWRKMKRYGIDS